MITFVYGERKNWGTGERKMKQHKYTDYCEEDKFNMYKGNLQINANISLIF